MTPSMHTTFRVPQPVRRGLLPAVLAAVCLLALPGAGAHQGHANHGAAAARPAEGTVKVRLDDTVLQDQDGRDVKLVSDVLGKRVIVVNFVYTTCTTVCPVSSATFADLQRRLGARVGNEVQLVSITVDPLRDTPARLKAYSEKHDAGPGWRWLTGRKGSIDGVLKSFGAYTVNPEDHPAMVMIGDVQSGRWTRLYGFPSPEELQARVDKAIAAGHAAHQH